MEGCPSIHSVASCTGVLSSMRGSEEIEGELRCVGRAKLCHSARSIACSDCWSLPPDIRYH